MRSMQVKLLFLFLSSVLSSTIKQVFLAQKHVQPIEEASKLVGELEAMVKVHVTGPANDNKPAVSIFVIDGNTRRKLNVAKPGCKACDCKCSGSPVPTTFPSSKGVVVHAENDLSYKAMIFSDWVKAPGFKIEVNVGTTKKTYDVTVGAPSVLHLLTFDLHYFGRSQYTFTDKEDWVVEFANRFPVKELKQFRIRNVNLQSMVVPPREGFPATLVHSEAHYRVKNNDNFDGEQATALGITGAINKAGKLKGPFLTYSWIFGVPAGGQAGGYSGVGNPASEGVTIHELGHALSLPHWGGVASYPYQGKMFGIDPPAVYGDGPDTPHVGPNWGFYLANGYFIPPKVQPNNTRGNTPGTYKADPMQGGGSGWQEPGFRTTHFSDYSVKRMQDAIERTLVVQKNGEWYKWDSRTSQYSDKQPRQNYAKQGNVEVMTFMVSISKTAIWMYPPFGPYPGAFDGYYDPTIAADRALAQRNNYRGDYTVKLWIGGKIKHILVNVPSSSEHQVWAVNLFPREGNIDQAQLLLTPAAHNDGVPNNAEVLFTYRGKYLLGDASGGPCPDGYSVVTTAAQCSSAIADIGNLLAYVPSMNQAEGAGTSCTWCGGANQAYLKKDSDSCEEKRFVCHRTVPVGAAKPSVDCEGTFSACENGRQLFTQTRKKFGAGKDCEFVHHAQKSCSSKEGFYYETDGGSTCPKKDTVADEQQCRKISGTKFNRAIQATDRPAGCFWDMNGRVYFNRNTDPAALGKSICGCAGGICLGSTVSTTTIQPKDAHPLNCLPCSGPSQAPSCDAKRDIFPKTRCERDNTAARVIHRCKRRRMFFNNCAKTCCEAGVIEASGFFSSSSDDGDGVKVSSSADLVPSTLLGIFVLLWSTIN